MRGALWVYGLPLLLLFAGALVGSALPVTAVDASALLGVTGLLSGFAINRVISRRNGHNQAYQPRVTGSGNDHCQAVEIHPVKK